jgi:pectate lyase
MYENPTKSRKSRAKKDLISVSIAKTFNGSKTGINIVNSAIIIKRANNVSRIPEAGIKYNLTLQYHTQYSLLRTRNLE